MAQATAGKGYHTEGHSSIAGQNSLKGATQSFAGNAFQRREASTGRRLLRGNFQNTGHAIGQRAIARRAIDQIQKERKIQEIATVAGGGGNLANQRGAQLFLGDIDQGVVGQAFQ